ncbi:MAG: NUDIX hydrolase, partial [Candidatus Korarchaeota archaeon]|nr:NUDIX hydrolase [Candidatus Korarchaeota archaeon]
RMPMEGKLKLFYSGRVVTLEVRQLDSRIREVVRHPGSVSILPVEDGHVYLIKQYRYPLDGYIWEIPAGTLEEGESPEECARRELEEETGLRAGRLEKMFEAYLIPGYGTEKMHFFLATELSQGEMHPEPSEKIEVHKLPLDRVLKMVRDNEIVDAKTVAALLWYSVFD